MQIERQFPSGGHLGGCLQLHFFPLGSMMFYPFITVFSEKKQVAYLELTSTMFKERYNNHNKSFNHGKYEDETELSKYVWK